MDAVMHDEALVHNTAKELRTPGVDPDDPPWRHGRTIYRVM
jgi:hypothetical protein